MIEDVTSKETRADVSSKRVSTHSVDGTSTWYGRNLLYGIYYMDVAISM